MTINGVTPIAIPLVRGVVDERSAMATPVAHNACGDQRISWGVQPRQHAACQASPSAPVFRANTTPPGQLSTDSQLASELDKNFGELHSFSKEGRLTQSSLRRIAAQELGGD